MPPKVFIEYHPEDLVFVEILTRILNGNGIKTGKSTYCYKHASYKEHAENILREYDFIIWILSKNTLDYDSLLWYSSVIYELEIDEDNRKLMLPIFIDVEIQVPNFLLDRVRYIIKRDSHKEKYNDLVQTILKNAGQRFFNS